MFEYGQKEKYTISSDCWYTPKFLGKKENEDYNKIYKAKI